MRAEDGELLRGEDDVALPGRPGPRLAGGRGLDVGDRREVPSSGELLGRSVGATRGRGGRRGASGRRPRRRWSHRSAARRSRPRRPRASARPRRGSRRGGRRRRRRRTRCGGWRPVPTGPARPGGRRGCARAGAGSRAARSGRAPTSGCRPPCARRPGGRRWPSPCRGAASRAASTAPRCRACSAARRGRCRAGGQRCDVEVLGDVVLVRGDRTRRRQGGVVGQDDVDDELVVAGVLDLDVPAPRRVRRLGVGVAAVGVAGTGAEGDGHSSPDHVPWTRTKPSPDSTTPPDAGPSSGVHRGRSRPRGPARTGPSDRPPARPRGRAAGCGRRPPAGPRTRWS